MTEIEAFTAGILEHPESDLPRLVYADWLECDAEPKQPERAEFIRLQCEIEQINRELKSDEGCELGECEGCQKRRLLVQREQDFGCNGSLAFWFGGIVPTVSREWFEDPEHLGDLPSDTPVALICCGFIKEVRAPMDWLIDGECRHCRGAGWNVVQTGWNGNEEYYGPQDCTQCKRTGRTPGHLADLVKTQPITFVGVTDKDPAASVYGSHDWIKEIAGMPLQSVIPNFLFDLIQSQNPIVDPATRGLQFKAFETAQLAKQALSDALLLHAKKTS